MNTEDKIKKLRSIQRFIMERNVLELIQRKDFGVRFKEGYVIEVLEPNQFANIDPNESFYYYTGPLDEHTRDFCRKALEIDKFFRQEDIDKLSSKAGYDVDLYMGSFNCRHKWVRARIKGQIQEGLIPDTVNKNQINKIGKESII